MVSIHFPEGLVGWTIFAAGLLLVAYRIRGIDAPRTWIEWVERQFTYAINLRFIGAMIIILIAPVMYLRWDSDASAILVNTFRVSSLLILLTGFGLLAFQNHTRHLLFATAESSDKNIRISSGALVIIGTSMMLLPFFF